MEKILRTELSRSLALVAFDLIFLGFYFDAFSCAP